MYPEQSKALSEAIQSEPQLQSILSSFSHVNDRTSKLISEINEKIDTIYPYSPTTEGKAMEEMKNAPQRPSVVNELRIHITNANQNADRLAAILRQLNQIL